MYANPYEKPVYVPMYPEAVPVKEEEEENPYNDWKTVGKAERKIKRKRGHRDSKNQRKKLPYGINRKFHYGRLPR